jgi:carboxyl-terminal processing protease
MNNLVRSILIVGAILLALLAGLAGGVMLDRLALANVLPLPAGWAGTGSNAGGSSTAAASPAPNTALINEAWKIIDQNYVDREAIKDQTMTYGAISGMVSALGDTGHSRFQTPDDVRSEGISLSGEFEGIGAYVDMRNGFVVIVTPMDGSPAEAAGLKPGDIVIGVDGKDVTGLPLGDVVSKILGPAGTDVTLTIIDPATGEQRDVTITRAKIVLKDVTWAIVPGTTIAHIRLASFSGKVTDDLKQAITDAKAKGATAIILDLRNNPGGLLGQATGVASQFLGQGNVMQSKDAQGHVKDVPVESGGVALDLPVVVLINQGSASASEIVAGALQDAGRAQLVGQTTFGTGTVMTPFDLSDGSQILLATELWLTPKGRVIWHQGIVPDVEVKIDPNIRLLLPEALNLLSQAQYEASGDVQLFKAVELLK